MIEDLYQQALESEIGEHRKDTDRIRTAVFEGEYAFYLQHKCVQTDTPSGRRIDADRPHFKIVIPSLSHDMCMRIITSMKDVYIPGGTCRRNRLYREMQALGLSHMGNWVTCHANGTYTISIRHLSYKDCSILCRMLFSW